MTATLERKARFGWGRLGLPIVVVGFLSYFMVFAKYPATRDVPWVNLPIMLVGIWIAWRYRWQNRKAPAFWTRAFSSLLLTGAVLITCLFCFYVFVYSYQLPKSSNALAVSQIPTNFTLKDHQGNDVSLTDFRGKHLIITFYRGYW